jgi:predicted transcriptional regulator
MTKETKEERFKRVAEKRVQNAIHSIRSLSQLANTKIYKWNNDQLEKIWQAIDKEIEGCKKILKNPDEGLFKL